MIELAEIVLAFLATSALLVALIHLLLSAGNLRGFRL